MRIAIGYYCSQLLARATLLWIEVDKCWRIMLLQLVVRKSPFSWIPWPTEWGLEDSMARVRTPVDRLRIAAYKESKGFNCGFVMSGLASYQYGHLVEFRHFKATYLGMHVEKDPHRKWARIRMAYSGLMSVLLSNSG
ncbi:hypothetical protein BHE74_00057865 [Ensete ventricosum]|nr:hypothetical protein BHE74_00057865 [Ensete ventricosum]